MNRIDLVREIKQAKKRPLSKKKEQFEFMKAEADEALNIINAFNTENDKCALLELQRWTGTEWTDV